jgi:Soluble NSF attachment protein, SNAP
MFYFTLPFLFKIISSSTDSQARAKASNFRFVPLTEEEWKLEKINLCDEAVQLFNQPETEHQVDEAADLYEKAGILFKDAEDYDKAADAYIQSGICTIQIEGEYVFSM